MALKFLLLGMIEILPRIGYELDKAFQHVLSNFWTAEQRQVYHALDAMEADGWITPELVIQDNAPNKRVYSITDSGREALHTWITTPHPPQPTRLDWMGQFFFGGLVEPEQLQSLIDARRERLKARTEALWNHIADIKRAMENPAMTRLARTFALRMLLFSHIFGQYENERRWLDRAQEVVDAAADAAPEDMNLAQRLLQSLYDDFGGEG